LRFYNSDVLPGTVKVTLADSSGTKFTEWTSPAIPPGAAPQFAISEIESAASIPFTKPDTYVVSIDTRMAGTFANILWQTSAGALSNLSTCDVIPAAAGERLVNVHSSLLSDQYPSSISILNAAAVPISLTLGVYGATDGIKLGAYEVSVPPAGLVVTMSSIEAAAQIKPAPGMFHYVVKAEKPFSGYLQHFVENKQVGLTMDMSIVCPLQ
jgi:hypothetical protein